MALAEYLDRIDGGPPDRTFHPRPPPGFGGPSVEAVAMYHLDQPDHWHLVSFGLSDLHGDGEPGDAGPADGWAFELSIRVAGAGRPLWAVDLLSSLAVYVWTGGHPFADGHLVDLRGPIKLDSDSALTAAMTVRDPALATFAGPFGAVDFLQVVALTADELELCRRWSSAGVAELMARDDPLLVTRFDRLAVTDDPRWTAEIARRVAEEGSDMHELRIASLEVGRGYPEGIVVQMGAGAASALGPSLRRELVGSGAGFSVLGDESELRFEVGETTGWSRQGRGVLVTIPLGRVDQVAALFNGNTGSGRIDGCADLTFRVVK